MSESPIAKKLKIEEEETNNGDSLHNGNTNDHTEETETLDKSPGSKSPGSKSPPPSSNSPCNKSPQELLPIPAVEPTQAPTQPTSARIDPNEIIAQLKESLRQEEAKLQFLRKLKLTQAKLKERQEKLTQNSTEQIKEESKDSTLPPPPPLIKPNTEHTATRCSNSPNKTQPFSVIVSNSQNIKAKPDHSPSTPSNMARPVTSLQPNRAAMAKILEEMILQQPSPKPKVLQWPICPNINDQEYLHYTGLEFIVDKLRNPSKGAFMNPSLDITCIQCGLDFSPEWEKTDKDDIFECYYCFTSKLRKQVREEHTERLKQGFIKVVQKEKEFERQLQVQQREEQLMQQKLAEQQRQQQQQIMEQQQRTLQLQLQQQTLEQLQRQQIANQLLQHLQKSRQQPGTNSALNTLLQFSQDPTNSLLAQLQKRGQQTSGNPLNLLQNNSDGDKSSSDQTGQLREYLLDLLPRLPSQ